MIDTYDRIIITLTEEEIDEALQVAKKRNEDAILSGRKNAHGLIANEFESILKHFIGALGEIVVRKYKNSKEKLTINTYRTAPDICGLEVKLRPERRFDLLIREDETEDAIYVLVMPVSEKLVIDSNFKFSGSFEIMGWIRGKDAKNKRWFNSPNDREKAFFVPKIVLSHMAFLPEGS